MALTDLGVCVVLTCVAACWLAVSGKATYQPFSDEDKGSREEVELFFLTNATTFVVGWSWVVLLRDVSTLTAVAASAVLGAHQVWARTLLSGATAFVFGPLVGICIVFRRG